METAISDTMTKVCKTCGEDKPRGEFSGCGLTPDRLQPNCRPCHEERMRAGWAAARERRADEATSATSQIISSVQTESADDVGEPACVAELPIPYPGFNQFGDEDRGNSDMRAFAKTMANIITGMLNEQPKHPNKGKLMELLEKHRRTAEMSDEQYRVHELYEANPIHKLTQEEKLHCIRALPISVVQKLFPHL